MRRQGSVRALWAGALGMLVLTCVGAAVSSRAADWHPLWLVATLAILGVLGDRVHARSGRMRLSAGLTIVGLAMALLGPAPAVAICLVSRILDAVLADGLRLRGRRLALAWNLGMYIYVLLGALVIRAVADSGVSRGSAVFALVVVATISLANVLNFLLAAIWIRVQVGIPIGTQLRRNYLPTLSWIAAPNFMVGALVVIYVHAGPASLLLSLVLLGAFYVLLAELLDSQQRRDQLEQRTLELASLQVGVFVTMVRTLSLRDKSTARHSAAVARYAHAIAKAAGCSPEQLRTVHTAGLLHDIGKFAFPDRLLLSAHRLSEADFQIVREHPEQGARLVRAVQGYEEIADVILAHHERPDGLGYPHGLKGDEITVLAQMISVADVYDVITGRDTYRVPVSRPEAIAELRRVAGSQLETRFVELFVDILQREETGFTHTEEADFETELAIELRVRELAQPRPAAPVSR
jgi:putative nucleotidyltransferase with HDIG domain